MCTWQPDRDILFHFETLSVVLRQNGLQEPSLIFNAIPNQLIQRRLLPITPK
jgi:hypothetical protein